MDLKRKMAVLYFKYKHHIGVNTDDVAVKSVIGRLGCLCESCKKDKERFEKFIVKLKWPPGFKITDLEDAAVIQQFIEARDGRSA